MTAATNETTTPPDTGDVFLQAIRTLQRRATPGTDAHTALPKLQRMLAARAELGADRYTALLNSRNDCAALIQAWNEAADLLLSLQAAELTGTRVYWPLQQAVSVLINLTLDIQEAASA